MCRIAMFLVIAIVYWTFQFSAAYHSLYCGKCSPTSGVQCIDANSFRFCDMDSQPFGELQICPTGLYCMNDIVICGSVTAAACDRRVCTECSNDRFACVNRTSFSLCFGQNYFSDVIVNCPTGKICSTAKYDSILVDPVIDFCFDEISLQPYEIDCGVARRESLTEPTRLKTAPEDPIVFCAMKRAGLYAVNGDATCKGYYYCAVQGSQISGTLYSCSRKYVFSPILRKCVSSSHYICRNK